MSNEVGRRRTKAHAQPLVLWPPISQWPHNTTSPAHSYGARSAPGTLGTVPAWHSARSVRPSARLARRATSARSVRPSARSARQASARSARPPTSGLPTSARSALCPPALCLLGTSSYKCRSALCLLGTSSNKCPLGTVPARHLVASARSALPRLPPHEVLQDLTRATA